MPIKVDEPINRARGKLRCALIVSPALKVTYCHPSYAHRTPIIAKPTPDASDLAPGFADEVVGTPVSPCPSENRTALITRIAATLMIVVQSCRFALSLVPRTFTIVTTRIIATEASWAINGESATISPRQLLKSTASVATEPLRITKKS